MEGFPFEELPMSIDIQGKWVNQHGSELTIDAMLEGKFSGIFVSGVGFPQPGEEFGEVDRMTSHELIFRATVQVYRIDTEKETVSCFSRPVRFFPRILRQRTAQQ